MEAYIAAASKSMQLPPSESLDNLLKGLSSENWSPEGVAMHSPGHHDMDLDRGPHPAPVQVKAEVRFVC